MNYLVINFSLYIVGLYSIIYFHIYIYIYIYIYINNVIIQFVIFINKGRSLLMTALVDLSLNRIDTESLVLGDCLFLAYVIIKLRDSYVVGIFNTNMKDLFESINMDDILSFKKKKRLYQKDINVNLINATQSKPKTQTQMMLTHS